MVNNRTFDKKIISLFCVLYCFSAFFFLIVQYTLTGYYTRIIVCQQMRLRSHVWYELFKKNAVNVSEGDPSWKYVNRSPDYLKKQAVSYLKRYNVEHLIRSVQSVKTTQKSHKLLKPTTKSIHRTAPNSKKGISKGDLRIIHLKKAVFRWPLKKKEFWLSSLFGPRKKPNGSWGFHYGLDMAAHKGTPVHAAGIGKVTYAGWMRGYGNTALVDHENGYTTRYAHLDTLKVSKGIRVNHATRIGTVGQTGYIITKGKDGSHLHFEVAYRGKQINPLPLLFF